MSMPWDRFTPTHSVPEPELPYVPTPPAPPPDYTPVPLPVPVPPVAPPSAPTPGHPPIDDVTVQAFARDLLSDAMGYVQETIAASMRGQIVDHANPTVTATTQVGRELVVADAKSRSLRTFLQGLGIDVTFAVVAVVATLSGADPFSRETWILFGSLLIKTLIQTVVSYVMRLKVTPTMKTEGETLAIMPVPRPMI